MKKKIFLLPLALLGVLFLVNWGCDLKEEEYCQAFEISEVCEIPNICCPEGEPCYYEWEDQVFYCNSADDCDEAEEQIIAVVCPTAKTSEKELATIELRKATQRLMAEVRSHSVCR